MYQDLPNSQFRPLLVGAGQHLRQIHHNGGMPHSWSYTCPEPFPLKRILRSAFALGQSMNLTVLMKLSHKQKLFGGRSGIERHACTDEMLNGTIEVLLSKSMRH